MHSKFRLLTPGPTQLPEEVRLALARDMIHHRKSAFKAIMHEVQSGLKELFATEQLVLPLASSGTGAMEAAVNNLFLPGEKVLVIDGGKFGHRWLQIARARGLDVIHLEIAWGEYAAPEAVSQFIDKYPDISGILTQASETSTGVLHPIYQIGQLTKDRDILLVVDGISAVGISPCPMDSWGIDCMLTGSQKGIMLPPGLALISLSPDAWEKTQQTSSGNFYFNLPEERNKALKDQTNFTTPVNLILGLQVSLDLILKHGLTYTHRKHWALTRMCRAGVQAMGLELMARERYTWGITSIMLPPSLDGQKILDMAAQEYNVYFAGGQEHLKGKILRIGHMGHLDWGDMLAGLSALKESVQACGAELDTHSNFLEQAMSAFQQAWSEPMPNLEESLEMP